MPPPSSQVFQILGVKWKEASAEEKAICEAEAEKEKVRYSSGLQVPPTKETFKQYVVRSDKGD